MSKPTMEFTTVPFDIGEKQGNRVQIVNKEAVNDLPFAEEVVKERGLAASAHEALHIVKAFLEVGPQKVAEDGRPRGITKAIKWVPVGQGSVESPTSAWDPQTCKCPIKAQLLSEVEKVVDATFVNVNEGIGVKLNYVAWLGAQTVIDVVKVRAQFAAYGNHMEWLDGDTAKLIVGTQEYALTCVESDVAHAVFNWPTGLEPEAGTQATFIMRSRGGVEEGEVYTSKKTVTIIAGEPVPALTRINQGTRTAGVAGFGQGAANAITLTGTFPGGKQASDALKLDLMDGSTISATMAATSYITASTETSLTLGNGIDNDSEKPDSDWQNKTARFTLIRDGVEYPLSFTFLNA